MIAGSSPSYADACERAFAAALAETPAWRGRPWGNATVVERFSAPAAAHRFDELVGRVAASALS